MGAVSAKYHLARKIVDPACWRQYESGMLTIRSLDEATDCGARDPLHWQAATVRRAVQLGLPERGGRRDELAHRLLDVRLEVAASYHALFSMESDQDQGPSGKHRDARYDGTLELEYDWTCPNAPERSVL
jgi:hypothetical protein